VPEDYQMAELVGKLLATRRKINVIAAASQANTRSSLMYFT